MKKIITTAVIVASACGFFGGKEILAQDATSHTVKKGDTLWDLSGDYLKSPVSWPKIWKINPNIANPHLILPGQIVNIPGREKPVSGQASATGASAPAQSEPSALARAGLASFSDPLPLIVVKKDAPAAAVQAGVPQLDDPARYYKRGIGMVTSDLPGEGTVLHTEQGWRGAGLGETILISAPGARVGQRFGVYRDMGKVPSLSYFGASPGHLLADVAIVEVVASDAVRQEAVIRQAFAEVKTDDLLGAVQEQPTISPRPAAEAPSVYGEVVAFHQMRTLAGPDDIVYLNVGAGQGVAPGDLLSVAGTERDTKRTSGEVMILRVGANTSAAVVTGRSSHEVHRGDVVGPPAL